MEELKNHVLTDREWHMIARLREVPEGPLREQLFEFLDQLTTVLAATTIVCYTMYTVDPETGQKFGDGHRLIWTVPFVVFGVARYMLLVQSGRGGGEPARTLLGGDPLFLANALGWLGAVVFALWGSG